MRKNQDKNSDHNSEKVKILNFVDSGLKSNTKGQLYKLRLLVEISLIFVRNDAYLAKLFTYNISLILEQMSINNSVVISVYILRCISINTIHHEYLSKWTKIYVCGMHLITLYHTKMCN